MRRSLRSKRPVSNAADTCIVATKSKKKQKLKKTFQTKPTLPMELIHEILGFLTPPQLLRVSSSCKFFRTLLTYKMVIDSAVLQANSTNNNNSFNIVTMKDDLAEIITPSPMRMLQLAAGRQCEHCHSGTNRSCSVAKGLYLCNKCVNSMFGRTQNRNKVWMGMLSHELVASFFGDVLKEPFYSSNDSRHGPIICRTDMLRIIRDDLTVEEYLEDSYHHEDLPDHDVLDKIRQLFQDASEEKKRRTEKRTLIVKRKNEALATKIKQNIALVTEKLEGPTKDFAMDFEETSLLNTSGIRLVYKLFDNILGGVSSLADKDLTEEETEKFAGKIQTMYETLVRERIFGFACLSQDCPFEVDLLESLQEIFPQERDVFNSCTLLQVLSSDFDGTLHDAKTCLVKILTLSPYREYLGAHQLVKKSVLRQVRTGLQEANIIVPAAHMQVLASITKSIVSELMGDNSVSKCWTDVVRLGKASVVLSSRLYKNLRTYWIKKKTKAFLAARDYSDAEKNDKWVQMKSKVVMRDVWNHSFQGSLLTVHGLLDGKQYSDLRAYHKELALSMMKDQQSF